MRKTLLTMVVLVGLGCASTPPPPAPAEPSRPTSAPAPSQPSASARAEPARPAKPYPATRQEAVVEELHGEKVPDPFRWLEDESSPEVQAWLKAQDTFARGELARLPARDALAQRFRELFYMESVTAPVQRQKRLFYLRTHPDREKAVLYWREGDGKERVLLDPNTWEPVGKVSLGGWVPSWDGRKVAFQRKPNAADMAVLHVVDVDSGEWSKVDVIDGGRYASPAWTPDNKGFYYEWLDMDPAIKTDERPGHTEVRFHALGTDPKGDATLFPRTKDPTSLVHSSLSRDGRYLFVHIAHGWSEDEVLVKRLGGKKDEPFVPLAHRKDTRYVVQAWKDQIYVATDEGAPRMRVFKVPAASPERKNWKELVPEDARASLQGMHVVGGHLALHYLKDASSELRLVSLDGASVRTLPLPGLGLASTPVGLEDSDDAYFTFSSFVSPQQVYRASVKSAQSLLWARVELPIDPSPYTVEQVWYPSRDGTKVSMFLVRRKDLARDGTHPVLLYGYGGFNVSMTPSFTPTIYPWLEAGGVYAVANLRGGGEYGSEWHEAGRLHRKQNVFDDFIAAAEFLVKERYTVPARLGIFGGSNGGLLVGAAMTQRPELFGAVVCSVPLLDMVRYHRFGSGRTWIGEYGSADNAADFKVLRAYSPYHQVRPGGRYPPLLMMSADHDDRVDPLHARKFVAALQAFGEGGPTWLRVEANAGHGGADQVAKLVEARADQYAFLMRQMAVRYRGKGMPVASPSSVNP